MNILNRTVLEVKMGDRFYKLECSNDSPLGEVAQSLVIMHEYISKRIQEENQAKEKKEQGVENECADCQL